MIFHYIHSSITSYINTVSTIQIFCVFYADNKSFSVIDNCCYGKLLKNLVNLTTV